MSKIIKKQELDLVIENVLRENGIMVEAENVEITVSDDETEVKHGKKEVEIEDTDEDTMDEMEEMDEDCDVVEESTNKLKSAIKDSTTKLIKEDLDNFKRLMNHRN